MRDLVVCSLEAWDDVWRRNQFFVDALLRRHPSLRVLFVEPAGDVLFDLAQRRRPTQLGLRVVEPRMWALRPLKALPRRLGSATDELLQRQVLRAARRLQIRRPVLWLNDLTYAPLITRTGWPTVYDVTDDWLLAPAPPREIERLTSLEQIALARADEVVVCSPALAASRGRTREVVLIPNAVDVDHFRTPRPRPADLPPGPVAVYVGSLHSSRLDMELVTELAGMLRSLSIFLIGPDSLTRSERGALLGQPNIRLAGPRRYENVPAYLQHADVVIVPHRVSPFTESLDPIKAYECLAVETPTVATPVAGFRELGGAVTVAAGEEFVRAVHYAVSAPRAAQARREPPRWVDRADAFEAVIFRAAQLVVP